MSKTVQISSDAQLQDLIKRSKVVVTDCKCLPSPPSLERGSCGASRCEVGISSKAKTDIKVVYADWCGPCQQIAPVYEKLSEVLSRPNKVTFTKVNVDQQTAVAQRYGVTA
jgi:thiol-disulfide isomerase/thioredoxin